MNMKEYPKFTRWSWAFSYAQHLAHSKGTRMRVVRYVGTIEDGTLGARWHIVPAIQRPAKP